MKMFKKSLSVVLALMMIFCCMSVTSFATNDKTVTLRIEGISECFYYGNVAIGENATVYDVLKTADKEDDTLTVNAIASSYGGAYIYAINSLQAGSKTILGWDGWLYKVDLVEPDVTVDKFNLKGGESIVVYYGDPYNTGMQYPIINTSKLSSGTISFTSIDATFDEQFNMVEKENPVTDYTLTWSVGNEKIELTPDENGVCKIPYKYLTFGNHTVQIEKYDSRTGLPTVLRYAPDFSVKVGLLDAIVAFFNMIVERLTSLF